MDAFLELNQTTPIDKITIKAILVKSEVSKQTFYNHFLDKNDLPNLSKEIKNRSKYLLMRKRLLKIKNTQI